MGQPNSTFFSKADREQMLTDMDKRNPQKPIQGIKKNPNEFEPISIFTDTQQAEMNRRQNENGGASLCKGEGCNPPMRTMPVVIPKK